MGAVQVSAPGKKVPPAPGTVMGAYKFMGGDPATPESWKELQGEEYLKTLPPDDQGQVKMLADGKMPFPSSFAISKPYWQQKIKQAHRYDPTFDAVNWPTRVATRKDFASGKSSQNITSFNTTMNHLARLAQNADKLNNTSIPAWNSVSNAVNTQMGDPRVNNFETDREAAVSELTRAFRGTGGNVHDLIGWADKLKSAASPAQLHGAIAEALHLLKGRIDALGDQYNRGMGKANSSLNLLNPIAQKAFKELSEKYDTDSHSAPAHVAPPVKITGDEEYDKLPAGAVFIGPDGKQRKKP